MCVSASDDHTLRVWGPPEPENQQQQQQQQSSSTPNPQQSRKSAPSSPANESEQKQENSTNQIFLFCGENEILEDSSTSMKIEKNDIISDVIVTVQDEDAEMEDVETTMKPPGLGLDIGGGGVSGSVNTTTTTTTTTSSSDLSELQGFASLGPLNFENDDKSS